MDTLLISIRPSYIEKILIGAKRYEYRTKLCKRHVEHAILYATNPIKAIVGEVEIRSTLTLPVEELWEQTALYSGIEHTAYRNYFLGRRFAHAYVLGKVTRYARPVSLEIAGIKRAPQSYGYICDPEIVKKIREAGN